MGKTTKHRDFALAFGERLWPAASDILADFAKRAATDQRLRTERIGRDEDVLHQIADMAAFLRFGARIEQIKADLPPKPFEDLQPHHVQMIEEVFITLPLPEDVALFTRILLALSGEPAKVLELLERVKIQATQRQRDALVGDLTQSVIDKLGRTRTGLSTSPHRPAGRRQGGGASGQQPDALGRKRQWGSINVDARTLDRTRRAIGDFVVENLNRTAEDSAVSMAATKANPAPATDAQAVEAEERAGALRQFRDLARSLKIDHHTKARFDTITRSMDQEALEQVRSAVAQGLSRAEIDQIIVDRLRICDIVEGYERTKELRSKLMSAAART